MNRRDLGRRRGRAYGLLVALVAAGAAVGGWAAAHALDRDAPEIPVDESPKPPMQEGPPKPVELPFSEAAAKARDDAARARDRGLALVLRRRHLGLVEAALAAVPVPVPIAPDPELAADLDDQALLRRERGDLEGARAALEAAKQADPDAARAELRDRLAAGDDAALRSTAKESGVDERPAATLALLGNSLRAIGAVDAADRLLDRAVDRHPGDFRLRIELAELLTRRGPEQIGRARAHFGAAVALRPGSVRAIVGHAWLLLDAAGLPAQAIVLLEAATRRLPQEPAVAYALGCALMKQGHGAAATKELERALAIDPGFALARAAIGSIALGQEERREARAHFRRSLEIAENVEARDGIGLILIDRGEAKAALAWLEEAVRLHPVDSAVRVHHAAALSLTGRYQEAIVELKEAVRLDEWLAEAQNNYAWELVNSGDPSLRRPGQALEHTQRACDLDPWNAWYRNTLGATWYRLEDWARCESVLEEACAMPGGGGIYDLFFLAMAKHRLGQEADARELFDRAELWLDEDPTRGDELERLHAEAKETLGR
jgi:tetratricopeptide (TPR) repeat protein